VVDINRAIQLNNQALDLTSDGHACKAGCLNNLGISFLRRFQRFGEVADIDMSVLAHEQVVDLVGDGHAYKPGYLNNLGNSLLSRFDRFGDVNDINKSIIAHQQAVDLTLHSHSGKHIYLNNLGNSLLRRFKRFGEVSDIDKSILVLQNAIDTIPIGHTNKPMYISNRGNSLLRRFERFGEATDIDKSIIMHQQAVDITPDGHAGKHMYLTSLGSAHLRRFEKYGEVIDIDRSIVAHQQAVDITPDGHASKPMYLSNLGISLCTRFKKFEEVTDIDKSILVHQHAINFTPDDHADKPTRLNNLGNSFSSRFHVYKEITDINNAILLQQQAILLMPDESPAKSVYLNNLGRYFISRFHVTSITDDLQHGLSSFYDSATSPFGPPHKRLTAAFQWALLAADHTPHDDHFMPLSACHVLMSLVPRVVWLGNSVSLRYQDIAEVGSAVNMAASIACQCGQPDLALEWLEQGRSIVWEQILHLRTSINDLECDHPSLAASLERTSSQLKALDLGLPSFSASDAVALTMSEELEVNVQRYRRLVEEWEATLRTVRQCQGYERFLLPKKLDELAPAAALGPIIYVNIDERRCDAIILQYINGTPKVDHVHLSLTSLEKIKNIHLIFSKALFGRRARWVSDLSFSQSEETLLEDDLCFSTFMGHDNCEMLDNYNLSDISDGRATQPVFQLRNMQRVLKMLWTDIVEPIFCVLGYTDAVRFLGSFWHTFHFLTCL
jgi:tetratricopeptide (TPR) repeat protein